MSISFDGWVGRDFCVILYGGVQTMVRQLIELCYESEGRCFGVSCEFGVVGVEWVMSRCDGR